MPMQPPDAAGCLGPALQFFTLSGRELQHGALVSGWLKQALVSSEDCRDIVAGPDSGVHSLGLWYIPGKHAGDLASQACAGLAWAGHAHVQMHFAFWGSNAGQGASATRPSLADEPRPYSCPLLNHSAAELPSHVPLRRLMPCCPCRGQPEARAAPRQGTGRDPAAQGRGAHGAAQAGAVRVSPSGPVPCPPHARPVCCWHPRGQGTAPSRVANEKVSLHGRLGEGSWDVLLV